jgi:cobalt-zinc-cadmium efflux system membrane fusion protein
LKVRGSLSNADRLLKGETFVKAEFSLPPGHGAEVPSHAVFLRGEKHCVLVEESPGHFARREVTVGSERGGRSIITDGVESGQRVVVEGVMLLEQMLESTPPT